MYTMAWPLWVIDRPRKFANNLSQKCACIMEFFPLATRLMKLDKQ